MGKKLSDGINSTKGGCVGKNALKSSFIATELLALEPRILFDGAAVASGVEAVDAGDAGENVLAPQAIDSANDTQLLDALSGVGPADEQRTEIAFVDITVEDYQSILAALGDNVEVVLIDSAGDGVEQLASVLRDRSDIDAIHIISHGRSGTLDLGTSKLTEISMAGKYADELVVIADAMSENGDILIYGCDFADGYRGANAVNALAAATGADVAASDDLTGAAVLGGDWDLEVKSGAIETDAIEALAFSSVLAVPVAGDVYSGADDNTGPGRNYR